MTAYRPKIRLLGVSGNLIPEPGLTIVVDEEMVERLAAAFRSTERRFLPTLQDCRDALEAVFNPTTRSTSIPGQLYVHRRSTDDINSRQHTHARTWSAGRTMICEHRRYAGGGTYDQMRRHRRVGDPP